ncbi:unnamed protein product [Rotaria sp. Silwood2]|nr:unnamed protein product [Rotaria sp. Silwood2]CAF4142028.1 unnamed protein product [Rotaria sp. Silwood2]
MAELMDVTAFLSMWINNLAATTIMISAAIAIIDEVQARVQDYKKWQQQQQTPETEPPSKGVAPVVTTGDE